MGTSGRIFRGKNYLLAPLLIFSVFACTSSPYSNTTSRWETLRTAKKINCEQLPKTEKQLDYQSMQKSDERGKALISEGHARSGAPAFNVLPLTDDVSVDPDKIVPFMVSSKDVLLGTYVSQGHIFGVFYSGFKAPGELQVRNLSNNTVVYKRDWSPTPAPYDALQGIGVILNKEGFFLAYKLVPPEESVEDQPVRVLYAQFAANNMLNIKSSSFDKTGPKAAIVGLSNPTKALLVWSEPAGQGQPPRFVAAEFQQTMTAPVPVTLRIQTKGNIETWSMRNTGDRLFFSLVEGDSLLGEARLRFIGFDWRPVGAKVTWNYTADVGSAHVGDSFVLSQGKYPAFIVSKWLDRESTLIVYEPGAEGRLHSQAFGVFPEGTTLVDSWQREGNKEAFALLRTQKGHLKEYLLCLVKY